MIRASQLRALLQKRLRPSPPPAAPTQMEMTAAAARAQAKSMYLGDHTAMCKVLGKHLMYVDTRDFALAPHLMWDGFWELWITTAIARSLGPGMVAVDVGANLGYYTLLMADAVGPTGQVFAFEPNERIARLLRWSCSVNGLQDRIVVDTRAAFSTTGEQLQFFIPSEHPMNASLYDPTNSSLYPGATEVARPEVGEFVNAETVRLDDVLPERVDVVKIDAEGAERRSGTV